MNQDPTNEELSELLHKDLRKFDWVDVGKLVLLTPILSFLFSSAVKSYQPPQPFISAPEIRLGVLSDESTTELAVQRKASTNSRKEASDRFSCGELKELRFADAEGEIRARAAFERCILTSEDQASSNQEVTSNQ